MNSLVIRYFLVELVRIFNRTVFHTGCTTRAQVLLDIPRLLYQGYLEVSRFSFYTFNFSISENLYVLMPADLDQLRGKYSHRAVIGGKGLVELSHVSAYCGQLLDKVNLETGGSKVQRRLDTADSSTNNHHITKITFSKVVTELLDSFLD